MSVTTLPPKTLQYDINLLLTYYNKIDIANTGSISQSSLKQILILLQVNPLQIQEYLKPNQQLNNDNVYEFDDLLSIIGQIQVPQQPSVYVLSFLKILAGYRQRCLLNLDIESGLIDAKAIDLKIGIIVDREMSRRKNCLLKQHVKIYQEMGRSQEKQYYSFEEEWNNYLEQFQYQTYQKLKKTKKQKLRQLTIQSTKLQQHARKNSILASPRLRQLSQTKKWMIKQGKYGKAIQINDQINQQKRRLSHHYEKQIHNSVKKRVDSLQKKNQNTLHFLENNSNLNMHKLLAKKKEGQGIMRMRMKNLREEAQRKLNQHLRNQLGRLRSSLQMALKV